MSDEQENLMDRPWVAERHDAHTFMVRLPEGPPIVTVGTWNGRDPEPLAKLIAALPDLVAAIRFARPVFVNKGFGPVDADVQLQQIDAALAKAGQEP